MFVAMDNIRPPPPSLCICSSFTCIIVRFWKVLCGFTSASNDSAAALNLKLLRLFLAETFSQALSCDSISGLFADMEMYVLGEAYKIRVSLLLLSTDFLTTNGFSPVFPAQAPLHDLFYDFRRVLLDACMHALLILQFIGLLVFEA